MQTKISFIIAPFSYGGPDDFAKDGPKALLDNYLVEDLEELGFDVKIIRPPKLSLKRSSMPNQVKNIGAILKINNWLAGEVYKEIQKGRLPLTIGGDHSLAIGTITGASQAFPELGVIWIDRHFDYHSPKNTPSWRAHGMSVAAISCGQKFDSHPDFQSLLSIGNVKNLPKIDPRNIVQIGIGEKSCIKPPTKWYSMEDIDKLGIKKVIEESFDYLKKRVKHVYVAWDVDSLNLSGTGTSGDGQLTLREGLMLARAIKEELLLKGKLIGFEIMEIAPKLEKHHKGQTVDWAIQIVTTCFGGNLFNNLSRLKRNIKV